jgi:hypothetical protein
MCNVCFCFLFCFQSRNGCRESGDLDLERDLGLSVGMGSSLAKSSLAKYDATMFFVLYTCI